MLNMEWDFIFFKWFASRCIIIYIKEIILRWNDSFVEKKRKKGVQCSLFMIFLDLMEGKKHKSLWRYWISESSYFTVFFVHVFGLGYGACMLYIVVHFRFHWLVEM